MAGWQNAIELELVQGRERNACFAGQGDVVLREWHQTIRSDAPERQKIRPGGMLPAGWLEAVAARLPKGRRHGVDQLLAQRSQEIRIALAGKLGARTDHGLEPGRQSHPED